MASIATLFTSFFSPPNSAQLRNHASPLSLLRASDSPARVPSHVVSLFNDNRQNLQPLSKTSLPEDVLSVVNPSLANANTLFFSAAGYNVQVIVEENEPEEKLLNRFRREVMKAGVIQESKRRRFFENKQAEKKRKTREAARRNRRRRFPFKGGPADKEDAPKKKKEDEVEDNWELPGETLP